MDSSFTSTINQGAQQPSQPAGSSSAVSASPNPATTSTSPPPADSASAPVADKARDVAAAASGAAAGAAAAVGLGGVANAIERNAPIPSSGGPAYLSSSSAASPASKSTTTPTTTTTTTSTTSSSPATGSDEASRLRSELASAKAEIARLQKQLDASESTAATLRSRGAGAVDRSSKEASTAQAVVELKGQEGVPVQVVAGIAFGVFVVTWCVVVPLFSGVSPMGCADLCRLSRAQALLLICVARSRLSAARLACHLLCCCTLLNLSTSPLSLPFAPLRRFRARPVVVVKSSSRPPPSVPCPANPLSYLVQTSSLALSAGFPQCNLLSVPHSVALSDWGMRKRASGCKRWTDGRQANLLRLLLLQTSITPRRPSSRRPPRPPRPPPRPRPSSSSSHRGTPRSGS